VADGADKAAQKQPEEKNPFKVKDIRAGYKDFAGNAVLRCYVYNPPDYAVYRTPERVVVQFADLKSDARDQRTRLAPLTLLRGQINALVDGWHSAGVSQRAKATTDEPAVRSGLVAKLWPMPWTKARQARERTRADHYDRRVGDAIVTALENDVTRAVAMLGDVKNDIISERTSIARVKYLITAFALAASVLAVMMLLIHGRLSWLLPFNPPRVPVWTAIAGGTIGAFFSIAMGLKGRELVIDLQNRDNIVDAVLRITIGSMSGGLLVCLLFSGLVHISGIEVVRGGGGGAAGNDSQNLVFVLGFFAGFFERLVPNLLAKTNLATQAQGIPSGHTESNKRRKPGGDDGDDDGGGDAETRDQGDDDGGDGAGGDGGDTADDGGEDEGRTEGAGGDAGSGDGGNGKGGGERGVTGEQGNDAAVTGAAGGAPVVAPAPGGDAEAVGGTVPAVRKAGAPDDASAAGDAAPPVVPPTP
jgi:hypothetical protein